MARQDIHSVRKLGNDERAQANFIELYTTVTSNTADIAAASAAITSANAAASASFTSANAAIASVNAVAHAASASAANAASAVAAVTSGFTTYTPTITASSGTYTTVSATGRYKQIGKLVFVELIITQTNIGTAGGSVQATLPVTEVASLAYVLGGRNSSPNSLVAVTLGGSGGAGLGILNGQGSTTIANGVTLTISGVYEAA